MSKKNEEKERTKIHGVRVRDRAIQLRLGQVTFLIFVMPSADSKTKCHGLLLFSELPCPYSAGSRWTGFELIWVVSQGRSHGLFSADSDIRS
jgi:hypothetical protein